MLASFLSYSLMVKPMLILLYPSLLNLSSLFHTCCLWRSGDVRFVFFNMLYYTVYCWIWWCITQTCRSSYKCSITLTFSIIGCFCRIDLLNHLVTRYIIFFPLSLWDLVFYTIFTGFYKIFTGSENNTFSVANWIITS